MLFRLVEIGKVLPNSTVLTKMIWSKVD